MLATLLKMLLQKFCQNHKHPSLFKIFVSYTSVKRFSVFRCVFFCTMVPVSDKTKCKLLVLVNIVWVEGDNTCSVGLLVKCETLLCSMSP